MKTCSKCRKDLTLTEFYRSARSKDGHTPWCKRCNNANTVAWLRNNPERARTIRKTYVARHPERVAASLIRYRQSKPDMARKHAKLRADRVTRAPGGEFSASRPEYQARIAFYGGLCAYCRFCKATVLDHAKPVSRGGSNHPANIYPACQPCNSQKHARKLYTEWDPRTRE